MRRIFYCPIQFRRYHGITPEDLKHEDLENWEYDEIEDTAALGESEHLLLGQDARKRAGNADKQFTDALVADLFDRGQRTRDRVGKFPDVEKGGVVVAVVRLRLTRFEYEGVVDAALPDENADLRGTDVQHRNAFSTHILPSLCSDRKFLSTIITARQLFVKKRRNFFAALRFFLQKERDGAISYAPSVKYPFL